MLSFENISLLPVLSSNDSKEEVSGFFFFHVWNATFPSVGRFLVFEVFSNKPSFRSDLQKALKAILNSKSGE